MATYIALLRAVNVGGTGKLPMSELRVMCADAGFQSVQTYIASGNVVFKSPWSETKVKAVLEAKLLGFAGKPIGVMVRTSAEMAAVLKTNPFAKRAPNFTVAIFLEAPPKSDALASAIGATNETMRLGAREIFVHYPSGMGKSKLRIPAAAMGTARNMNTVAALAKLSASL